MPQCLISRSEIVCGFFTYVLINATREDASYPAARNRARLTCKGIRFVIYMCGMA